MMLVTDDGYEVRDGKRSLRFHGKQLTTASSHQGERAPRWTEISLYRTNGGRYVITVIGRSVLPGEVDRHRTQVADTAEGAVEALYMYDSDNIRYLTNTAKRALEAASKIDEGISRAFHTEHID